MKRQFLILTSLIFLLACNSPKKETSEVKKSFSDFLAAYYDERMQLYPLDATQAGDNRYNDLLQNDISESFRQKLKDFYTRYQTELNTFTKDSLTLQEQVSYDIFSREMTIRLKALTFHDNYIPVQQFWGNTLTLPQIGSGQSYQPFKSVKDYDNFLGRIEGFSIWTDTAIVNMRKGLAAGITYPKILMERVLPQAQDMLVTDVTKSIFWQPIASMPDSFPAGEKERIKEAYTKAINEKIIPTYKKLHDFLKDEYIPKTRTAAGISNITGGKEYYQYLINFWTTTNLTPEEIYATGLSEVERIKKEMEEVKNQVGFKGDLKKFFAYVNDDKKFMPYKTPEEVIAGFNAIHQKMEPQLKKLFNMVPRSKFEVRRTEAFREASASAEYNQGSPDGTRPGVFYVPILDAKKFNYTGMETLFLHEAIPGHHYQNSLQMENKELPSFRQFLWYGAYGEGWALYTESLGKELGLYTDPYQYFGHLGDEMHRAIRLVVDVGMHTKGMTREEAIKYMTDNEPISEQGAVAEIERYMAIPGQALSYKIGQLKISELRKKAEQELGTKFNIALYHDEVLKYGCLPLDVLETIINRWIEEQKKAA
ncbi:MAG TPA: DUF885 domain-containing protein [Cyclobacteriaceae bacterium]|nr:DUF885 domain-containing protein [Cyclobacteriaceae bacterium]